jgi:hypothetical protein
MVWTQWAAEPSSINPPTCVLIQRDRYMDSQRWDPNLFTLPVRLPSRPFCLHALLLCYYRGESLITWNHCLWCFYVIHVSIFLFSMYCWSIHINNWPLARWSFRWSCSWLVFYVTVGHYGNTSNQAVLAWFILVVHSTRSFIVLVCYFTMHACLWIQVSVEAIMLRFGGSIVVV